MTRFEQELSGALGTFWKTNAEKEIAKMQEKANNDEIGTDENGAAFWRSNGNYIPADCAEKLSHTDFLFSLEETAKAREAQTAAFFEDYRKNYTGPSEETLAEMRAELGKGTTVVDLISGKKIRL